MAYEFGHLGITARNLEASVKWYKENFNFQEVKRFSKPELRLKGAVLKLGDFALEILEPSPQFQSYKRQTDEGIVSLLQKRGANHFALSVDDVNSSYNSLRRNNVTLATEIIDSRYFFCCDLDNVLIEVRQKA